MYDNRSWLAAGVAASAFVFALPTQAAAQSAAPEYQINLPSQDLGKSLNDIAKQTSTEIAFDGAQAEGKRAAALRGRYSAIEAVRRLLEGTGLRARVGSSGAIIVQSGGQLSETGGKNIVVTGFRQAFNEALDRKRNADQVIDVITNEDIGQFPDQNVTEALQRIAGVSIQRNNGEGELVSIRGLDPIFTRVEIDGRTTTITADSSNPERSAVLSPLVSDLYSSIEVIKSPTAADVEGGIGGTVRLNTPSPLDIGELTFAGEIGGGYSEYRESFEPSVLGFYADTFANDTLGVLAIVSYEELSRRVDLYQNNPFFIIEEGDLDDDTDPAQLALVGGAVTDRMRQEQRDGDRSRFNATLKVEYEPDDDMFFSLNGFFAQDERDEDRSRIQAQWGRGNVTGGTIGADGETLDMATFRRHRVDINTFNRIATVESYGITGDATFTPDAWTIDFNANYGQSEEDYDEYVVQSRVNRDDAGGYDITQGPRTPVFFTDAANLALSDLDVRSLNFEQRVITLEEYSGQTDVSYEFTSPVFRAVQVGGRYSSTRFDRLQGVIQSPNDLTLADAPDANFALDGTFGRGAVDNILTTWPSTDPFTFYNAFPSDDEFTFNDEQIYFVEEDVWAAYGMLKVDGDIGGQNLRGNVGVRYVDTSFNGQGRIDVDSADFGEILIDSAASLDASYQDWLPSANVVLAFGDQENILFRAAVARVLTRPTIEEINPSIDLNFDDVDGSRGNPDLDPFRAWSYDAGVEIYFGEANEGLFSATFFYKDVENFIAPTQLIESYAFPEQGIAQQDYLINTFENGGAAEIYGVEVNFQTPFTFLPAPFDDFGIFANYTYTDSSFTNSFGNTFSFPGASEHVANLVGYYESGIFSTRLAYNYRDDFLIVPSSAADGTNASFGQGAGRLDFAVRLRFDSGVRMNFDVLNITEEQEYNFYDTPNRLDDLTFEGRVFQFSIGYRY